MKLQTPPGFILPTMEVILQIEDRQQQWIKYLQLVNGKHREKFDDMKGMFEEFPEYLLILENYVFLNKCIAEYAEIHKYWLLEAQQLLKNLQEKS